MGKFRIIPILLTNGNSIVKGQRFDNWRTVGAIPAQAALFAARDVDELVLLDVTASSENRTINEHHGRMLARTLRVPLAIGGGINSVESIKQLLGAGADKVVIGKSAFEIPGLIQKAASVVGSQSLTCSVDIASKFPLTNCSQDNPLDGLGCLLEEIEDMGFGEVLLQNSERDGTMTGLDPRIAEIASKKLRIPFIIAGGLTSWKDALRAFESGASGVGVGALFQFTEETPDSLKSRLAEHGVPVRI
jgi:imidazole glycerol-phosphate synthase subunit HisF